MKKELLFAGFMSVVTGIPQQEIEQAYACFVSDFVACSNSARADVTDKLKEGLA